MRISIIARYGLGLQIKYYLKDFDIDSADFTFNNIFITHYKLAKITPK